eukprot:TRINITY_DN15752_c0_g1_i2.p1 TRINITY_DN15752_c0_g1~~TRINITY_DN15752_c0_g1_i2.p1  ORF type:complete len:392 (+),score=51.72 TRINITY_DN15752_c0_g1_i2:90-1178(+)
MAEATENVPVSPSLETGEDVPLPEAPTTEQRSTVQQRSRTVSRSSVTFSAAPGMPPSLIDFTVDPRTGLALVPLPPAFNRDLVGGKDFEDAVIFFAETMEKTNPNGSLDRRAVIITSECVVIAGSVPSSSRWIQITQIKQVALAVAVVLLVVPNEFDSILRAPPAMLERFCDVIVRLHKLLTGNELQTKTVAPDMLLKQAMLNKPKTYACTPHVSQTRIQLLASLHFPTEPRTGLPMANVPTTLIPILRGVMGTDPLVFFFAACLKVGHKLQTDRRFCFVTDTTLYLAYPKGNSAQRAVPLPSIHTVGLGDSMVGFHVPEDGFDLLLQFSEGSSTQQEIGRAACISHHSTSKLPRCPCEDLY